MIEVRELTKRYGAQVAVDRLTFDVAAGRVTGFLGPNGAGKSTTLRLIVCLDAPDSGTARIGGCGYRELRTPLREVGTLLDPRSLHPGRTGFDHLLWLARSNGLGRRRVEQVLGEVGLSTAAGRRTGGYSLGMLQRLGIAAALLAVFGVLLICGEYSTGMIRVTLAAMPRRLGVLLAKSAVAFPVASMAGLIAGLGAYLVGSRLLKGSGHAEGEPFPALFAIAASSAPARSSDWPWGRWCVTKLELRDRTQAAIFVYESGLVTPTAPPQHRRSDPPDGVHS